MDSLTTKKAFLNYAIINIYQTFIFTVNFIESISDDKLFRSFRNRALMSDIKCNLLSQYFFMIKDDKDLFSFRPFFLSQWRKIFVSSLWKCSQIIVNKGPEMMMYLREKELSMMHKLG